MALQHFYSRVPAKFSMFNRTDGFDTFVCSQGIAIDFIEKELVPVCETKPTLEEADLIRKGELSPVYCQFVTKAGQLVQSCISYIPSDYTGERSSYLVHSYIFSEEEKHTLLYNPDNASLNPEMFSTDITPFNITSPDAKPISDYPQKQYTAKKAEPTANITAALDAVNIKRLIFAVLSAAFGKTKSVFITVIGDEAENFAIDFINTLLQIIPYHLRAALSFVSRIGDVTKFPQFKIKFVPDTPAAVPPTRCAMFNFRTKTIVGVKDEEIKTNSQLVDFFASLLSQDSIRREFLAFADRAVTEVPALGALNIAALSNLVFLFRCGCGMYDDKTVLATDKTVLDFFTIYEKNRAALSNDYRMVAVRCLQRYPENHIAIPKNIFAKVIKIYPTDTAGVKRIIMNVARDLIHTDLMRDKLFAFMKSNYSTEDADTKELILQDLCSVFYGGFLQQQILDFFAEIFTDEPQAMQDMIVDKLLLSIRTIAVMPKIIQFFDTLYSALSAEAKAKFYVSVLEHLVEGDELACRLLRLVDNHIREESQGFRDAFLAHVCDAVEAEQRKDKHLLLTAISDETGICTDAVTKKVFKEWSGRKIFPEFIATMLSGSISDIVKRILAVRAALSEVSAETINRFIACVVETLEVQPCKFTLYQVIESEQAMLDFAENDAFCNAFISNILQPMACRSLYEVFTAKEKKLTVEDVAAYAKDRPAIKGCEQYSVIDAYLAYKTALIGRNANKMLLAFLRFPTDKQLRKSISTYMQGEFSVTDSYADVKYDAICALSWILNGYLKNDTLGYTLSLEKTTELFAQRSAASPQKGKKAEQIAWETDSKAFDLVLSLSNQLYQVQSLPPEFKDAMLSEASGLSAILLDFAGKYPKKGKKHIGGLLETFKPAGNPFIRHCRAVFNTPKENKPGIGGLFSSLFKKKK